MADLTAAPKIRALEAFPTQHEGQPHFILRDPFHYSDAALTLSPLAALILQMLNGRNTILDIQAELTRAGGKIFPSDKIEELVRILDDCFFLENEKFSAHKREVEETFVQSPVRASPLAGRSYPADPAEVRTLLDGLFAGADGALDGAAADGRAIGVISPHIDYARGGTTYTPAYRSIAKSDAETFVIFGVSHSGGVTPLIPTRKNYQTPFGAVETDRDLLGLLEKNLSGNSAWADPYAAEFAHAHEHSIEFQMVFLQYLRSNGPAFRVLPILCAFSHEEVQSENGAGPIRSFLAALSSAIAESGRRVAYIAGVDFAHVGAQFGDEFEVREKELEFLRQRDEQMMMFLAAGERDGFHQFITEEANGRRVCGYPALYSFLSVLPESARSEGRVLKYGQWPDPSGTVTFGSLAYHSRE